MDIKAAQQRVLDLDARIEELQQQRRDLIDRMLPELSRFKPGDIVTMRNGDRYSIAQPETWQHHRPIAVVKWRCNKLKKDGAPGKAETTVYDSEIPRN